MKKIALFIMTITLVISLTAPAIADGGIGKSTMKRTVDKDGSITLTSSLDSSSTAIKPGTITPNAIHSGTGYYWEAKMTSNWLLGYYSGSSNSFTNSTKSAHLNIDVIDVSVNVDLYDPDLQKWCWWAGNGDWHANYYEAYANGTYFHVIGGNYRVRSSHSFENGSVTWFPNLVID